jgi:hypothetical protein
MVGCGPEDLRSKLRRCEGERDKDNFVLFF